MTFTWIEAKQKRVVKIHVWEHIVGNLNLKTMVASMALVGASALSANAASVVYDNNGANGVFCSFGDTCSFQLTGSDAAAGTTVNLSIVQDAAANDNTEFEFAPNGQGLGLGFLEDSNNSSVSLFAAAITLQVVGNDLTWIGGGFSSVDFTNPLTTAVNISGTGLSATVFGNEPNFNPFPGQNSSSAGFEPQSFSLLGQGINFLDGETYTLAFSDFADAATQGDNAFLQFQNMEFVTTASIPLPATAWMMIGALGFLGWRKYRAA